MGDCVDYAKLVPTTTLRIPSAWLAAGIQVVRLPQKKNLANSPAQATIARSMTQPIFRRAIEELIRIEARPVDKFSHQPRLYHLARRIAEGLVYDDDVLHAAAWLHDLGVFVGHSPEEPEALARWDCVAYAMAKAPEILDRCGFPAERIPAVVEAIRCHQPQCGPTTMEGTILRDADILEQLGAVSVLRTVGKIGRDTRFATFSDALSVLRRNVETLSGQITLPRARVLAAPRIEALRAFLAAAEAEADGQPL